MMTVTEYSLDDFEHVVLATKPALRLVPKAQPMSMTELMHDITSTDYAVAYDDEVVGYDDLIENHHAALAAAHGV